MKSLRYSIICIFLFFLVSCNRKISFSIDYDLLEKEYKNFGDELIEKYTEDFGVSYDYTVKFYQNKFNLIDDEIRILGEWTKVSSYYDGEADFIIPDSKRKIKNDVRSVTFYANRVCVIQIYWDTYIFGSWRIADKQLLFSTKYRVVTKDDSILNLSAFEDQNEIVLVSQVAFTDYYIFIEGFNFKGMPKEIFEKYKMKKDVPRVKHSFYWPGENAFDLKSSGGKLLYNFGWNEDSVKNMYNYFFTKNGWLKFVE